MERGRGVRGVLLNVGGDLRVAGETPRTIGISAPWSDSESSEPIALIEVKDRAVATSGSSQRGFEIDGRWYSHIFDPRSGLPAEGVLEATVIAPRSADADALATICNVLSPEEGRRLVESCPEAECLIVARDGRITRSKGWERFERPGLSPADGAATLAALAAGPSSRVVDGAEARPSSSAPAPWGQEFELVVNFEINQPERAGRGYRRPYVAIWVENKDGFPVRNLTLWVSMGGAGPFQWLPDLKRWYKADQARKQVDKKDMFITIARPTRPPGKVQGDLGRQGRQRQARPPRRVHRLHRRRPRTRDVSEPPQGRDPGRQAVQRRARGKRRDQVGHGRVSPQDSRKGLTLKR